MWVDFRTTQTHPMSTAKAVRTAIAKLTRDGPFTGARFLKHGTKSAVERTLSRFAAKRTIRRLSHDVFVRSRTNRFVCTVMRDIHEVVETIARSKGETIQSHHTRANRTRVPYKRLQPHDPHRRRHCRNGQHPERPPAASLRRTDRRRALCPLVSRQGQRDPGNGRHHRSRLHRRRSVNLALPTCRTGWRKRWPMSHGKPPTTAVPVCRQVQLFHGRPGI